jgi:large subunit ribosomal protein L21
MKYAIVKIGNKQFMVHEGDILELERQEKPLKVAVIMYSDDSHIMVGDEQVKEVKVKASVIEEKRSRKIRVGKFLAKSTYRKTNGHRQPLSVVKIEKISVAGEVEPAKAEVKPVVAKRAKPAVKKPVAASKSVKKGK